MTGDYVMKKFQLLTAGSNIAAAIALLFFWFLYAMLLPYQELDSTLAILVRDPDWLTVNIFGIVGSILGIIGWIGIYVISADRVGVVGLAAFLMTLLGSLMLTTTLLWDTILWPILVTQDPTLLSFTGPIYNSASFVPFFILSGLLSSSGYLISMLCWLMSSSFTKTTATLIGLGGPLFGLGALFGDFQVPVRTAGILMLAIGLAGIGQHTLRSIRLDKTHVEEKLTTAITNKRKQTVPNNMQF
jgi:hypothetical protein